MSSLPILNGHDVTLSLSTKDGAIMVTDLVSLYFINKYTFEEGVFLSVHIPARPVDTELPYQPAINYEIVIRDKA